MLKEQTLEQLAALRLLGMLAFLRTWMSNPEHADIGAMELVGLLVDAERVYRDNKRLTLRLSQAKLRHQACVEDIDYAHPRGLSKAVMLELSTSAWIADRQSVVLSGPTGVGKSYLACALGNKACRDGYSVLYRRTSRLFDELAQARADGSYSSLMRRLAKTNVLILDDFGVDPLNQRDRRELLEVLEDRCGVSSTIITTQLDPSDWHATIGDETIADSICDRVLHSAYKIKLKGESLRKTKGPKKRA